MTTSGGGMFLSPESSVADRVRYLATQARQPAVHYEHADIGFNYRLSNLLAAMGRAQLDRLPEMSQAPRRDQRLYRQRLADVDGLTFMPIAAVERVERLADVRGVRRSRGSPRRRASCARRRTTSRAARCGSRCTCSRCSPAAAAHVDGTSERLFEHGLCLPSGSVLTDDASRTGLRDRRAAPTVRSRP